jgi:hypothetical protein
MGTLLQAIESTSKSRRLVTARKLLGGLALVPLMAGVLCAGASQGSSGASAAKKKAAASHTSSSPAKAVVKDKAATKKPAAGHATA